MSVDDHAWIAIDSGSRCAACGIEARRRFHPYLPNRQQVVFTHPDRYLEGPRPGRCEPSVAGLSAGALEQLDRLQPFGMTGAGPLLRVGGRSGQVPEALALELAARALAAIFPGKNKTRIVIATRHGRTLASARREGAA